MPTLTQNMVAESAALLPTLMWSFMTDDDGEKDPFFEKFPLADRDTWMVQWDQKQSPYGLAPQGVLDGPPPLMVMPGRRVNQAVPGVYRFYTQIRETELTTSREPGTISDAIDVPNRLNDVMLYGGEMIVNRIRKIYADLGLYGYFNNESSDGVQNTYQIQNYSRTGVSAWISSPTTATPIDDLRTVQSALNKGTSTRFGQKSNILMSDEGVSALLKTSQIRNSFKSAYGASFLAPFDNAQKSGMQPPLNGDQSLNKLFFGMGLPPITPWNYGYFPLLSDVQSLANKGNYVKFLPSTSLIWLGNRPNNQQLGQFTFARHAGNLEKGDAANFDVVRAKSPDSITEFGNNIYVRVHYINRQPNHYDFEFGFNSVPEVWYDDAMASVYWS